MLKNKPSLRQAVGAADLNQVRAAIAAEANVNEQLTSETYPTPLFLAVATGCTEIVALLVAHGADANYRIHQGKNGREYSETPLSLAVRLKKTDLVNIMVNSEHFRFTQDADIAVRDAIWFNQPQLLGLLLKKHRDLSVKVSLYGVEGFNTLMLAIEKGYEEAVHLLLTHGAPPHQPALRDDPGSSAYALAVNKHYPGSKMLSIIMSCKQFNGDFSPLLTRLQRGIDYFAAPLIAYSTRAFWSAVFKSPDMNALKILLEQGADPNQPIKDSPHETPLSLAILAHHVQAALMMVKSPRFTYTPNRGGSALMIAKSPSHAQECITLITLLEKMKATYEDDRLWASLDDEVIRSASPTHTTSSATYLPTAPSALRPANTQILDDEKASDKLYGKNGLYEL